VERVVLQIRDTIARDAVSAAAIWCPGSIGGTNMLSSGAGYTAAGNVKPLSALKQDRLALCRTNGKVESLSDARGSGDRADPTVG
jgi:hypothetical protein